MKPIHDFVWSENRLTVNVKDGAWNGFRLVFEFGEFGEAEKEMRLLTPGIPCHPQLPDVGDCVLGRNIVEKTFWSVHSDLDRTFFENTLTSLLLNKQPQLPKQAKAHNEKESDNVHSVMAQWSSFWAKAPKSRVFKAPIQAQLSFFEILRQQQQWLLKICDLTYEVRNKLLVLFCFLFFVF